MIEAKGDYRSLAINTALGMNKVVIERLSGREEVGRLFSYRVDLLSQKADIAPEQMLGTNATVIIGTANPKKPRYISGYFSSFTELGECRTPAFKDSKGYRYRGVLSPLLWFATRRSDCRTFLDVTVPDMVKTVLAMYGAKLENKESGSYTPWKYCTQYRETDFNFISRLMEQEGIWYYFKQGNGSQTMVLMDSASSLAPNGLTDELELLESKGSGGAGDYLEQWYSVTTAQPGKFSHRDYDFFKNAPTDGAGEDVRGHTFGPLEIYDYPAQAFEVATPATSFDRTSSYASVRMKELQSQYQVFHGSGDLRGLEVGRKFTYKAPATKSAQKGEYLVLSTSIDISVNAYASGGSGGTADQCTASFTAIKATRQFAPQRLTPKPVIQGAQTAIVINDNFDKWGRCQVQFHWSRGGSNPWVRVGQMFAGKQWGGMFLPRNGQEVIVEFLDGDPDRPVITGAVYNGKYMPPYDPVGHKTRSTIKTNSWGGGGFNELRFEDKDGAEQIFLHAQKQLDVRVTEDSLTEIGRDLHLTVVRHRHEVVKGKDHLKVEADLNEEITGIASRKASQKLQYESGTATAIKAGTEIHIKAGTNLILEAGVQVSIKVGGSFINVGPAGVDISGPMVKVNSGGSAGSGSGSSPKAPEAPKEPDKAESGQKGEAPPAPKPPPAQTYSPQAVTLQQAAQSGAPTCQK